MSVSVPAGIKAALEEGVLGIPVDLGRIDEQLDLFFDTDEARTRASLTNFAIYSENPDLLLEYNERLKCITQDHACRALLIILAEDRSQPARVRSWINAHCHMDQRGAKTVCSEQLSFLLEGDCRGLVTNVVFAHLRSDLPLAMWWQGELSSNFERELYSRIDRLIVDSCCWQDPRAQYALLKEIIVPKANRETPVPGVWAPRRDEVLFHDLAHTRGHRFRLAVAHAFDDPRVSEHVLPAIEQIEITCGKRFRTSALYLGAWVSCQLGLKLETATPGRFLFSGSRGEEVAIELREGDSSEVALEKLRFSARGGEVTVQTACDNRLLQVQARIGDDMTEEMLPAPCQRIEELVGEVLMRGGNNQLINKILPRFLEMLAA